MPRHRLVLTVVLVAVAAAALPASAGAASPPAYVPGQVVVGVKPADAAVAGPAVRAAAAAAGVSGRTAPTATPATRVLHLRRGTSVAAAVRRLRARPGITYAVPNYLARASGQFVPDDRGWGRGWQKLQWNFLAAAGVDVEPAWAAAIAAGRPGARGVRIAVLDTGVAYRSFGRGEPISPDFRGTRFVAPYDFVDHDRRPYDRPGGPYSGHGTHVAGTIAEQTNNRIGVTGLAYRASIMPVRVLDAKGFGDAATIARGIRWAVAHHAQIINLSLTFRAVVVASWIPDIISALHYAERRGVLVVAAAGNKADTSIAYPARTSGVVSVGATTADRCLADYSNVGSGLTLVAPGGGYDSYLPDRGCNPDSRGRPIYQMTFTRGRHFGLPGDFEGTSMAAAHVSGVAALVIASGVLGPHPRPSQVIDRLERTATDLGSRGYDPDYGWGLVNAAAATSSG
jgi:serine protease